ncbi:MAG: MFS transporter [Chloroflexi bacterium]|nr:MFS transporter [Chloroflexota bacterium]
MSNASPEPTPTSAAARRPKLFFGWWITIAAAIQAFWTSGTFFYGFSAFFNPIANEFGWSRAATATALSLQRTESGVFGPFVGFLVDRYGAKGVMIVGTVITALGFFWLARIESLTTFYLAFGAIALGMSFASMVASTAVVGNWFSRYRGRAMTIAFSGGGLGGIMAPPLVWAIATFGWRSVIDWIGFGTLLVGILTSLIMRRRPEEYGYLPDGASPSDQSAEAASGPPAQSDKASHKGGQQAAEDPGLTVKQIMKTRAFWQIVLGMGLSGMVMSTVVVFAIPGLESFGVSTATAGLTVLFISLFNLAGRFTLGFMADYVDKRKLLAFTYLLLGLGALAFGAIFQTWQIALFLLLYAPGHGGTVPIRFSMVADYFGRKAYASIVGITMTLTAIFGIVGPVATGALYDATGSYRWAFIVMGLLSLAAIPLTLALKQPQSPATKMGEPAGIIAH